MENDRPAAEHHMIDIEEHQKTLRALQHKQEMLERTEQIAEMGSWDWNIASDTVRWSEGMFRIFRLDPSNGAPTISKHPSLFHTEDMHTLTRLVDDAVKNGTSYEVDLRIRRQDGTDGICTVRGIAEKDAMGNVHKLFGSFQDITARKRTENALKKSEKKYRQLFETSKDGIAITDLQGRFLDCNKGYLDLLGYTCLEDVLSRHYKELTPPEYFEMEEQKIQDQTLVHGYCEEYEKEYIRSNGERVPVSIRAWLRLDDNDSPVGMWVIARDISDRKKIEKIHTEYELQLLRTQKLDALGVLAGGIAHDFNNLLGGIFGNVDLALESKNKKRTTHYLTKALGALNRARALTQQLLTFTKGEEPIRQIEKLQPVIEENVLFSLSGSKLRCQFHLPDDLWLCEIDKNQIGQVIDNIVINAQQAMPDGGTIEVAAKNVEIGDTAQGGLSAGKYVKFSITDHGIGIPLDTLHRIFDPFYTTKKTGFGLGLASSYSIISRHHGCIEVESELGKGSTFHIFLPASTKEPLSPKNENIVTHERLGTIVVLDDEAIMRETIEQILQGLGYFVISTSNGTEVIEILSNSKSTQQKLSGMLLDLTIPGGVGGRDIIDTLRKLDTDIPVFVVSGYVDDPILKDPQTYGFTASIAKPFRRVELANLLKRYVAK